MPFLLNLIMLINSNKSNAANNSNGKRTAQPSEMGKYSTPELQAAFDAGRTLGRTEGMLSYQRHIMNQLFAENQKLNRKLQEQKEAGHERTICKNTSSPIIIRILLA